MTPPEETGATGKTNIDLNANVSALLAPEPPELRNLVLLDVAGGRPVTESVRRAEDRKNMARSDKQKKAQAAWDRIEALGGHGVWEVDMVVVSFGRTKVTDEDLILFRDFPFVQVLDLSDTNIGDEGLAQLGKLPTLEELIVSNTKISAKALKDFQRAHPTAKISTGPPPKGNINPFTGKPF